MDFLQNHIEALIFCSPTPAKVVDIKACLFEMFNADVPEEDIVGALQRIEEKFQADEYSFQLFKTGGGYQFLTKPAYQTSCATAASQVAPPSIERIDSPVAHEMRSYDTP